MGTILSVLILAILSALEIAARYPVAIVAFFLNVFLIKIVLKKINNRKNRAIMTIVCINLVYVFGLYLLYLKLTAECLGKMCGAAYLGIVPYAVFGILSSIALIVGGIKKSRKSPES